MKRLKTIIAFSVILLIIIILLWQFFFKSSEEIITPNSYTNNKVNFSFNYPESVEIIKPEDSNNTSKLSLKVLVRKMDEFEDRSPPYDNYEARVKEKQEIQNGQYGPTNTIFEGFPQSNQIINLDNSINAKTHVIFQQFEECNVSFFRRLLFYKDNYQIYMNLIGPVSIIDTLPEEYIRYSQNCGNKNVWQHPNMTNIYSDLTSGSSSPAAQNWFEAFDEIVSTIQFN